MSIKRLRKILMGSRLSGALWGVKISRFLTNDTSLYLANDTRQHHSYYGRWI